MRMLVVENELGSSNQEVRWPLVIFLDLACGSFLSNAALCLGAGGINKEIALTALKVGACFASMKAIEVAIEYLKSPLSANGSQRPVQDKENKILGQLYQAVRIAAAAVTYRQVSLILGCSMQVAKWAMVVKAISLGLVQSSINYLIDGIASKDQQKKSKRLAEVLIVNATLGVIARIAGCSNKVAVLVTAILGISSAFSIFILQQIRQNEGIPGVARLFLMTMVRISLSLAAGRALRPLLLQ